MALIHREPEAEVVEDDEEEERGAEAAGAKRPELRREGSGGVGGPSRS